MENASKALIMAGGMLIAILITSLLIYAWQLFSEYQSSQDSLSKIEDVSKFNSQFTSYDRDDILGYELLSLINKVIDYNEKKSEDDSINGNDDQYPYIHMQIDLVNEENRKKFTYNNSIQLFKQNQYVENELTAKSSTNTGIGSATASGGRASFKANIENEINRIKGSLTEDDSKLSLLSKNISSVFLTEAEITSKANANKSEDIVKKEMVDKFNNCIGSKKLSYIKTDFEKLILNDNKSAAKKVVAGEDYYKCACAYYEYMQFKRGIFECTELKYDESNSGRVQRISFRFTGNIH